MYKSKPEFKRAPMVEKTYDLDETIGVASRKKQLEDMKLRIEEAENRAKNIRLRKDWVEHQKKSLYQGELDSINRQLERPNDAVFNEGRTKKKQSDLKNIIANII